MKIVCGNRTSLDKTCNLEAGDRIIKIDDISINSIEDLKEQIKKSRGEKLNILAVDVNRKRKEFRSCSNSYA